MSTVQGIIVYLSFSQQNLILGFELSHVVDLPYLKVIKVIKLDNARRLVLQ